MKILFAIAALSFAALVWAALAILRHVRKNSVRAAAQPAADAELSEAMDLRLSELARTTEHTGVPQPSSSTQQDFSYFIRETASPPGNKKAYAGTQQPSAPAVADPS